jgi:Fur family ferric uptake transcriptional regulator
MYLGQGSSYYEHITRNRHHEHICCEKCGKVIEFTDKMLETRIRYLLDNKGFISENHSVQIYSTCVNCREQSTSNKQRIR